jgi:hypothetical protein
LLHRVPQVLLFVDQHHLHPGERGALHLRRTYFLHESAMPIEDSSAVFKLVKATSHSGGRL